MIRFAALAVTLESEFSRRMKKIWIILGVLLVMFLSCMRTQELRNRVARRDISRF